MLDGNQMTLVGTQLLIVQLVCLSIVQDEKNPEVLVFSLAVCIPGHLLLHTTVKKFFALSTLYGCFFIGLVASFT
jgi:hypothetical protein